jgi:hypothetical protein
VSRKIEELHAADLRVDHTVNRDEPPATTVQNLIKKWKREATGVLTASHRDDGFKYVLDGQSRRLAALQCDPSFLFVVEVHYGLSMAEEIDLFEYLNKNRRPVAAIDLLRLRVTRGREPYATLGIQLARHNLALGRAKGGGNVKLISAAAPLELLLSYTRGKHMINRVLEAVIDAYPHEETRWRAAFFGGVVNVHIIADREHVLIDQVRMVKTLQRNLPRHWENKARDRALTSDMAGTGSLYSIVSMLIIEQYNKRLTKNTLPTPWLRGPKVEEPNDDE